MGFNTAIIVDDSKLARVTLKKKLEAQGLQVEVAESASKAYDMLGDVNPDIVFMDHLMPDIDGFQATQHIRTLPGYEALPIIMCSGKEHEGYLEEAQAIGANQILSKPPVDVELEKVLNTDFSAVATPVVTEVAAVPVAEVEDQVDAGLDESRVQSMIEKELASVMEDVRYLVESQTQKEAEPIAAEDISAAVKGVLDAEKESLIVEISQSLTAPEAEDAVPLDNEQIIAVMEPVIDQKLAALKEQLEASVQEQIQAAVSQSQEQDSASDQDMNELLDLRVNAILSERFKEVDEKLFEQEEKLSEQMSVLKSSTDALMGDPSLGLEGGSGNSAIHSTIERQIDGLLEEHDALTKRVKLPTQLALVGIALGLFGILGHIVLSL